MTCTCRNILKVASDFCCSVASSIQAQRTTRSTKHAVPEPVQARPPQQPKRNGNSTILGMLELLDQQSSANQALWDELRQTKGEGAVLDALLNENVGKVNHYKQSLGAVRQQLCNAKETLNHATEFLQETQEELHEAEECIEVQDKVLMEQAHTISNLQAENNCLAEESQAMDRNNQFLKKQLACEQRDNKGLTAELQECKRKLAAAEINNNKMAQHNAELQAAKAGDYTALVSTVLSVGFDYSVLLWFCAVLVFSAIGSCVLLQMLLLSTAFTAFVEGLLAAPRLLQEATVYAVVSWSSLCDLWTYVAAGASAYYFQGYASCSVLFKCLSAATAGRCTEVYVGCVGLLNSSLNRAKALVCSYWSPKVALLASSGMLLPCLKSWGSARARVSTADVTPTSSNRSSADATDDTVSDLDDVAPEVFVVVALKKGTVVPKDTDV